VESRLTARVESLDHEGRGVARVDGKVVFIRGALPGEIVNFSVYRKTSAFDLANVEAILQPSAQRVAAKCVYFDTCGGCSLQHLDPAAQVAAKQRVLEDALERIGKIRPEVMLPAIHGPAWGYRARARLAARLVEKKGGVLVGFHEKRSSFIVDMRSCEVLPARLSELLVPLRGLLGQLSIRNRIPQIEVAVTEQAMALSLRILLPLSNDDVARLRDFGHKHNVDLYLQPGGPETVYALNPGATLSYTLPEFGIELFFGPVDFTQVNPAINRALVRRAVSLLDPKPGERIADFYCGIGNFSLPLARRDASVEGFEGSAALVERAKFNAKHNGLDANARFFCRDLYGIGEPELTSLGRFDKILLDPPRDGAIDVVKALGENSPRRIVYISCNPATLARDASVLVHVKAYRLGAAGIFNMFPHTAHVESIALFEK
jgi:23S rRNA (uracil1939-C5)-methyltransferase